MSGRVDLFYMDDVPEPAVWAVESVIGGEGWTTTKRPTWPHPASLDGDVRVDLHWVASPLMVIEAATGLIGRPSIVLHPFGIATDTEVLPSVGFDGSLRGEWASVLRQFLHDHDPEHHVARASDDPLAGVDPLAGLGPAVRARVYGLQGASMEASDEVPAGVEASSAGRHVFISYSRTDQAYVDHLVEHLGDAGIPTWIDKTIDYGDRWHEVIEEKVDSCAAMVVVMTPAAKASTWVEREIQEAEDEGKTILPLLLDGKRFFRFGHIQYEDVRGGSMPSEAFIGRLQRLVSG